MKYDLEIKIKLPRERVVELFDNPENMPKWQPGFISMDLIEGESGMPGAKSKLKYKMGKRNIEMVETIRVRNLPSEFHGSYDANGVHNEIENYFVEIDENTTLWKTTNLFEFTGWMKLMGWIMPGAFKKQSKKYMELFKAFAEEGKDVRNG